MFKDMKFENYQSLILSIFSMIDLENNSSTKTDDGTLETTKQFNEIEGKQKFQDKNKKDSIFQNTFYSIKEEISSCTECGMATYNFEYIPFILIEPDKEEKKIKITEKILNSIKKEKNVKCNFCGGGVKKCNCEIKINEFSEILIIIINDKIQNLSFENNFLINNNQNKYYNLFSFIEKGTKNVYFVKNNNWLTYNENYKTKNAQNREINPIVLFYKIYKTQNYTYINNNQLLNEKMKNKDNNINYAFVNSKQNMNNNYQNKYKYE